MRNVFIIMLSLVAGVLLGSCQGDKTTGEELLSVSPGSIEALSEMASYKIDVVSNTAWSVSLKDENGDDVFWAALDRSSGHDNAKITVRVTENKYKDPRKATVLVETTGGKSASVNLVQKGNEQGSGISGVASVRLGSYNLRMSNLDTEGDNVWSARKERLRQSVIDCAFDVFGIQEVSSEMQEWLVKELGNDYTFKFFSPYSQNGSGNKAQGIVFRTSAFSLAEWHFFWLSDSPGTMSTNDTGSSGSFNRGGCCCILTHKQSGVQLFFMNSHGCLNAAPNASLAHIYIEQEKVYNPKSLPSFFVGDLNARPESKATETYRTYWKDSYDTAKSRSGAGASYNGFNTPGGKYRIDYIYLRGDGIDVKEFCISNKLYGGKYASDHFPVYANISISK